jgi:hypothetical protein
VSERVSVQQVQRAVQAEVQEDEDDGFHLLINASAGRGGGVHLLQRGFRCHLYICGYILSIQSQISLYIYIYILSANDYSFPEACYDTRGCLGARLGVKRTSASLKLFFPRLHDFTRFYDFPLKTDETLKLSFVR